MVKVDKFTIETEKIGLDPDQLERKIKVEIEKREEHDLVFASLVLIEKRQYDSGKDAYDFIVVFREKL